MKHIAIFASGGGSNAEKILEAFADHSKIQVNLIVTNSPQAGVITRAHRWQVPCLVISKKQYRDGDFLVKKMQDYRIDLIALAGYLKLIPAQLIQAFPTQMLNIHPSLLPKYGGKGMYGMHVHDAVIASGESHSGMTIHRVNEQYDKGEILFQEKVAIQAHWDAKQLQQAVLKLEHANYHQVIANELIADS